MACNNKYVKDSQKSLKNGFIGDWKYLKKNVNPNSQNTI